MVIVFLMAEMIFLAIVLLLNRVFGIEVAFWTMFGASVISWLVGIWENRDEF